VLEDLDLSQIKDPHAREVIERLLNLVEELASENRRLRDEVQQLRDEINRLKGEKGKPQFKGKGGRGEQGDISSAKERRRPKKWQKRHKKNSVKVDREEVLDVDRAALPPDAEFKGYVDVVVQDVVLKTDNVRFWKAKYYSPTEGRTYLAPLPDGYRGEFGPGVRSLALVLYFGANVSEAKLAKLFDNVGLQISSGQVSNLLIQDQDRFHDEKAAIYKAGLASSRWQVYDTTGTRVDGHNAHCHIVCNDLYTAYFTRPGNDRLTVIDVLRGARERRFLLNEEALSYVEALGLSALRREQLSHLPRDDILDEVAMDARLSQHLPGLGPTQRQWILSATALAAYRAEAGWPIVPLLVADGAPQFKTVTDELALCWVHEGRRYKKLIPLVAWHRRQVAEFLTRFWSYYRELRSFRQQPTPEEAARLEAGFDELFATVTGYRALDERIANTKANKDALLTVLAHPEIPLHTNAAELGARARVRKRDVSYGPRTDKGVMAWDTFATLAETAKKLGLSFHDYIHDRVSGAYQMPALADLVAARAEATQPAPS
jgi:hypothetical protein